MLTRHRKKFWVGLVKCVMGPRLFPVLLLLQGQIEYLYVFDRVLSDAERRTSREAPSQSWPPPRVVPRAQARHIRPAATPSRQSTSSSPAGSCCTCSRTP